MGYANEMRLDFIALPENEAFARTVISAFLLPIDPTVDELNDIKTAVSEAVTNAIVHGYDNNPEGIVRLEAKIAENGKLRVVVKDAGFGIEDIEAARQPFYTSKPNLERTGMGFTVMESFMDTLEVKSTRGRGTSIIMTKMMNTNI